MLTLKQKKVLDFIKNFIDEFGFAPTLKEIQDKFGISYKRGVVQYLKSLQKKGYIQRTSEKRGIRIVKFEKRDCVQIPVCGFANAGQPLSIAEDEQKGFLEIDKKILKESGQKFALILKGDSMNKRKINGVPLNDGNFVVILKNAQVKNGDCVLAVIDNCATVKTIQFSGNLIILYPESSNPVHKPIYLSRTSEFFLNGKVLFTLPNPNKQNLKF